MTWSGALTAIQAIKVPNGYELSQLREDDVDLLVKRLRDWYPDIVVGAESCHLSPDFYRKHTLLAGRDDERPIFPVVGKHRSEIIGVVTFERNLSSRTIFGRLGALAPEHRGPGLGLLGPLLLEKIGQAIGAELAYYFATLKTPHQQVIAERRRYQIVGIVPAFDRDMVRPGEVRRVYEAVYAKVLVGDDAVEVPPEGALTARTRAVWKALFARETPDGATGATAARAPK
jgi:hypothetical protein